MKVELDTSKADAAIARQVKYLSPRAIVRAGHNAVNRAIRAGNAEMSRQIRQTVNLRASTVKNAVDIKRSTGTKVGAELKVSYKQIPLKDYKARQTRHGISVRLFKGSPITKIAGGFVVESLNGQAFIRVGDRSLPIKLLTGPSVRSQAEAAMPAVQKRVEIALGQRMRFEIGRAIERANR
jgi:hypothetical protein